MSIWTTALLVSGSIAQAQVGVVTWLNPDSTGEFRIESAAKGVTVAVINGDSREPVRTVEQLAQAGWEPASANCWRTPQRSGGGRLEVTVSGLPAGIQTIYLRYTSQPRQPGNEWWFATQADVINGRDTATWLDHATAGARLVAGTGGYDPETVYEAELGVSGASGAGLRTVSFWIQRYEWSQVSQIGSIRIETAPDMDYAVTQDATPAERAIATRLLANGPQNAAGQAQYGVGVVSATLKVRPKSFASLLGHNVDREIRISAARGEYESRQLIVYSPEIELADTTLFVSELLGPGGALVQADNIVCAPVGYCPYDVPYDLDVHGYWPEPILTFLTQLTIRRHDVQSIWYRVFIPRDTPPGDYTGTVTLRPGNAPDYSCPVRLTVWDFEVPAMSNLRVVVGCNRPGDFEMSYKLNPSTIYGFDESWIQEFPAWAERGATAINLAYVSQRDVDPVTKLPTDEQVSAWCDRVARRFEAARKAGLEQACYVYMFDEATADWHPAMRRFSDALAARFPRLLQLTTAHATSLRGDNGLPALRGWCPLVTHYDLRSAEEARLDGMQVWWYTCNSPQKPYPNLLMTHPAVDARLLMGFMAFAYATDGFLYYATAGGYYENTPAITAGPYTQWTVPDNAHNHLYQKGPDGPLPSLRLEAIRDGLEDYDMLCLARTCYETRRESAAPVPGLDELEAAVLPLFKPGSYLLKSLVEFTQEPTDIDRARKTLAEYIIRCSTAVER